MDNGTGFSMSDAVLTSAMSGGFGNGGRGNWGGYNYGGCSAPYADLASNAVRINRNEGVTRDAQKCTQDTLTANLARISDQAEEGRRSAQFTALVDSGTNAEFRTLDRLRDIRDGQFQAELRTNDRLRDLERITIDGQRDSDKAFCETQKEILRSDASNSLKFADASKQAAIDHGATTARLAAIEAKIDANKEISELRAQLQTQQIFATCGCGCGGGVKPCPTPV